MWFNFLFGSRRPSTMRRQPTSVRPALEALDDRLLPSTVAPVATSSGAALVAATTPQQQNLHVTGVYNLLAGVQGNQHPVHAEGYL
jgi:hypothetical protein